MDIQRLTSLAGIHVKEEVHDENNSVIIQKTSEAIRQMAQEYEAEAPSKDPKLVYNVIAKKLNAIANALDDVDTYIDPY